MVAPNIDHIAVESLQQGHPYSRGIFNRHRLRGPNTVTLPDGTSTISYGYGPQGQLTTITYADQSTLSYEYEDPNNRWLLTGITDESNQRYATYVYDYTGLVTHEEHAGGADAYDFNVGTSNAYSTDALGQPRSYFFTNQNGVFKLNASAPYCSGCPNTNSASFDAHGNPQAVRERPRSWRRIAGRSPGRRRRLADSGRPPLRNCTMRAPDSLKNCCPSGVTMLARNCASEACGSALPPPNTPVRRPVRR